MKIYSVSDPAFKPYGKVLTGFDTAALIAAMKTVPMPESGTAYEPSIPALEESGIFDAMQNRAYGGMPIQIGMCWGYNTKLNCLEYHRDSEIDIAADDVILLVARQQDIQDGKIDSSKTEAFLCPKGTAVELYATTLHYAPCSAKLGEGFRVVIVLPKGTNEDKPALTVKNAEDNLLWAQNKWLLAHKDTAEAADGAHVGITGDNIDIADLIK